MYVRSLINEAKEKAEKEPKKTMKKEVYTIIIYQIIVINTIDPFSKKETLQKAGLKRKMEWGKYIIIMQQ
jgi:hypothetical protein